VYQRTQRLAFDFDFAQGKRAGLKVCRGSGARMRPKRARRRVAHQVPGKTGRGKPRPYGEDDIHSMSKFDPYVVLFIVLVNDH
jgi:hypothetical protein